MHLGYFPGFHIKKYASSLYLRDLNVLGELSMQTPFRPGGAKKDREENRFPFRENNVGKSNKLDHPQRICYHLILEMPP